MRQKGSANGYHSGRTLAASLTGSVPTAYRFTAGNTLLAMTC